MARMLPRTSLALAAIALALGCESRVSAPPAAAPLSTAPALPPIDPATSATLIVRVRLSGKPPANPTADVSIDRCCAAAHPQGLTNERVLVGEGGALANVYVHVKSGLGGFGFAHAAQSVALDQKGCVFSPRVVALQVGDTLSVTNGDATFHNVLGKPAANPTFNEGLVAGDAPLSIVFRNPEVGIPLACNVHPWMQAWCCVSADPVFGVSGADGQVALHPLPPAEVEVEIEAWHEVYGSKVLKVTLAAKESRTVDLEFEAAAK